MSRDPDHPRVLVVDDSRFDQELAAEALAGMAQVACCASADEALAALAADPADLVVSDLEMPGRSGLELLEAIRREHPGTAFVLLTARASVESAIRALRMGAADYLQKPIRPDELGLVVERVLSQRRLLRENVRLRDALATLEACRSLTPCLEAGEVYPAALDLVLRAIGRPQGVALFRRGQRLASEAVAIRGLEEAQAVRLRELLVEEKEIDLEAIRRVEILGHGPVHQALREAQVPVGRLLALPVHGEEGEGGVLWVLEHDRPFSEGDIERASIVAGHAALALRNAERYTRAKERAFIDDVTELYNARYLREAVDREIQRAERYGSELAVVFLDLDRFKLVNDRFGHLVGSQALRRLSQILSHCVRQVDTLARYGGDEFTILLVDTNSAEGRHIAERIRRTVAETPFETGTGEVLRLTVSLGVATYPHHGRSRDELLEASDKAMYRAKSQGRDQVCSAEEL